MLKDKCCPPQMFAVGLLALRMAVGIIFIHHGWDKWHDIPGTAGTFQNLHIPFALFMAYLVATVELVGGIMVLLGVYAKEASKFLAMTMIVALLTAHVHQPFAKAEFPLVLLGATLTLIGTGAGPWRLVKKECCYEGKK